MLLRIREKIRENEKKNKVNCSHKWDKVKNTISNLCLVETLVIRQA